jgi:transcriptional regulator with XRE-family HTH domain
LHYSGGMAADRSAEDAAYLAAFGHHLKILRVTVDLTQTEVAERAGVTRHYIGLLERGEQSIDLLRLRRLASALEVDLPALLDVR